MCGISGIYTHILNDDHVTSVNTIIQSQSTRGPDHSAFTSIQSQYAAAILGHNRLSIIDLSEQANQPMWDATGRYCIVYNGEIYNYVELRSELIEAGYVFNTKSDTEVILNAFAHWGPSALTRFFGPFAFALFDKRSEKLWLCRDRFGVRPLFYAHVNHVLYFASTSPALAKILQLKPNLSYIAQGLNYLVYEDGTEQTAYLGLHSLPSGCYLEAETLKERVNVRVNRYYDLGESVLARRHEFALSRNLLEEVEHTFNDAVKIRLRSDVPLAISLSSGLDSSSVAALVSRQHDHTIGFSFSNPNNRKSEGPLVAKCAQYLNIDMEYVWPNHHEMVEALDATIAAQDAPFSTLSIVAQYLLYQRVRQSGIKVLLGGQGGDEAFMGYRKFVLFWLKTTLKQKNYLLAAKNLMQCIPMFVHELSSFNLYWRHRHRFTRKKGMSMHALQLAEATPLELNLSNQTMWHRQMQDITQFSLPTLLRYEDRNAMGHSVESRLPFLDHRIIELGLALPESLKLRKGYGKWAMREVMRDKIPNEIRLARYKRGFDLPLNQLIHAGLGKLIRDKLQTNKSLLKEFLLSENIHQLFSDQQLLTRQNAMTEAISLLWLNKVVA